MSGPAIWYFSRGTGLVALLGLTGTTVLGVLAALRVASPSWPRFLTQGLHRNLSLLTVTMLALHIVAVVIDGYVAIGWLDVVIPFRAGYHPVWVGLGAVAADLLAALVVTSLLRHRLGYRTWRAVHWAAYAVWPLAVAHGLGVGSDAGAGWVEILTGGCVAALVAAVGVRLAAGRFTAGRLNPRGAPGRRAVPPTVHTGRA